MPKRTANVSHPPHFSSLLYFVFLWKSPNLSGPYYIGIDAGATSSYSAVFPGGKVLKHPPVNLNLNGLENSGRRLAEIIESVMYGLLNSTGVRIAVCVAGAANETLRSQLEGLLRRKLNVKALKVYPDVSAAFASAFEPGIPVEGLCGVIIAGTGSVLYLPRASARGLGNNSSPRALDPNGFNKIGGWGRLIGDEGSGYWIGREALRKVTHHYDGREDCKYLAEALKKKFKFSPENLVKKIYHDNFEISKITKTVFRCAENGDNISKAIIKEAAQHLADHLIPVLHSPLTKGGRAVVLALCGSLFSEETLLEKYFREIVKKNFPNVELIKPKNKPVWGALKLAMNPQKFETHRTQRPKEKVNR